MNVGDGEDAIPQLPRGSAGRWIGFALVVAAGVSAVLMLWRLRYGAALTDEAFYMALPYRFVLGDVPFLDEFNILQTAGILCVPLVWLWTNLVGSTEGLVLFMRLMWFALASATALVALKLYRHLLPAPFAVALAAVYLMFVPFTIPNLSYNTISSAFLTIGLGLLAIQRLKPRHSLVAPAVAGVLHGLAVFAYPTMAVAVAATVVTLFVLRRSLCRQWAVYLLSVSAVFAGIAALALVWGFGSPLVSVAYMQTYPVYDFFGGISKFVLLLQQLFRLDGLSIAAALVLMVPVLVLWNRLPRARLMLSLLPAVVLWYTTMNFALVTLLWVPVFGVGGLILLIRYRPESIKRTAQIVAPTALIAGAATAYTSTNGLPNAGIGLAPILLVALPLVLRAALSGWPEVPLRAWAFSASCTVALLAGLVGVNYLGSYASSGMFPIHMTAQVSEGPWAYMYGTEENVAIIESIQEDVDRLLEEDSTVMFTFDILGGYLMTDARPAAPSVWFGLEPGADIAAVRAGPWGALLREHSRAPLPDVVFRGNYEGAPDELYAPLFYRDEVTPYRRVLVRERYDVFVRE